MLWAPRTITTLPPHHLALTGLVSTISSASHALEVWNCAWHIASFINSLCNSWDIIIYQCHCLIYEYMMSWDRWLEHLCHYYGTQVLQVAVSSPKRAPWEKPIYLYFNATILQSRTPSHTGWQTHSRSRVFTGLRMGPTCMILLLPVCALWQ